MPADIRKAMVLAAGYGLRLRPWTDRVPKPLIPVAGKPMIEYALDRLREQGVREVVINVSHLRDQLVAYAAGVRGLKVVVSDEPEPLETGGGLRHALPLLGQDPFYVINSDIIWVDGPERALDRLARHWDDRAMDILLLAQPRATAVGYDQGQDHLFVKRDNTFGWDDAQAPYIMAGVSVMHPRLLAGAPEGKFSAKVLWLEALSQGRLACVPHRGLWFQTGSLPHLQEAEARLQQLQRP